MTKVYASGQNTFVPDHTATAGLTVDYARNIDKFALNKYIQIFPVTKSVGYYSDWTVAEAGRVMQTDGREALWEDGADHPHNSWGGESFDFLPYETRRYSPGFNVGYKASEQASWDYVGQHQQKYAQQQMTRRTVLSHTLLSTGGNWPAGHSLNVAAIPGVTGQWNASTVARQDVKRSIEYAQEIIALGTLDAVDANDFRLIMGPDVAQGLSICQEFVSHISQSPFSLAQWKGEGPVAPNNQKYGMSDKLYGVDVIVDSTVRVTSAKNATRAAAFVWTNAESVLVTAPGALVTEGATPAYSTVLMFAYEEMTAEVMDDADNRRIRGRVTDDIDFVLVAGASGFRFGAPVA